MDADRSRSTYDPKISPPGAGPQVACPPTGAGPSGAYAGAYSGVGSGASSFAGGGTAGDGAPPPQESLRTVSTLIAEMKEYAALYLATKIDGVKITLRTLGIFAVLGVVGLIAGSAFITTAAVLLLVGAAWGLGRLFSPSYDETKFLWLGALAVGLLIFTTIALGAWLGLKKLGGVFKKSLVQKYEQRQNWERGQFGHNARERAAQLKS